MNELERNDRSDGLAGERRDERGDSLKQGSATGGAALRSQAADDNAIQHDAQPRYSINLLDRPGLITDRRAARLCHQILSYLQGRLFTRIHSNWPLGGNEPEMQHGARFWQYDEKPEWFRGLLAELREVDFDELLALNPRELHFQLDKRYDAGRISIGNLWQINDEHALVLMQCVLSLNPSGRTRLPGLAGGLNAWGIVSIVLIAICLLVLGSIYGQGLAGFILVLPAVASFGVLAAYRTEKITPLAILALYIALTEYYLRRELPGLARAVDEAEESRRRQQAAASVLKGDPHSMDKHHYVNDDLDRLDSRMLQQRLYRIDNKLAREIANELFERVRRTFKSVDFLSSDPKYRPSLRMLCGNEAMGLLKQLRRMQKLRLSGLIMEGPEFVERILGNLHPIERMMQPPPHPTSSRGLTKILVENVEFFGDSRRSFSWRFGTVMNLLLGLAAAVFLLYISPEVIRGILLLLFGPGFLFLFWGVHAFMQNSEQRLLALYISFTDELVQHELEQHGGEAGDGA